MTKRVRVFTVAQESRYVIVRNIPALGVLDDLLKRLSLYGTICEYRVLDHRDDQPHEHEESGEEEDNDQFTDIVWVKYETVNNARHAKIRGVQKPFFGSILKITYAPQYETKEDTALKLQQRRELLQRRARGPLASNDKRRRDQEIAKTFVHEEQEFIGPQLPPSVSRKNELLPRPVTNSQNRPDIPKRRRI